MILNKKSDEIGVLSSALCLVHCFATPILLVAVPSTSIIHPESQDWWGWLDMVFLAVSFFAIVSTIQPSTVGWLRTGLIVSWILLSLFIINERLTVLQIPEVIVYIPAFALIIFHLINRSKSRSGLAHRETEQTISLGSE